MNITLVRGFDTLLSDWPGEAPPTVADLLKKALSTYPQLAADWYDDTGELRPSLAVFVNGEHIRYRNGLRTELRDGDEVYVIPLIAGG